MAHKAGAAWESVKTTVSNKVGSWVSNAIHSHGSGGTTPRQRELAEAMGESPKQAANDLGERIGPKFAATVGDLSKSGTKEGLELAKDYAVGKIVGAVIAGGAGKLAGKLLPEGEKVVNSNMAHASEQAVGRAGFTSVQEARTALQEFGAELERSGLPGTAIRDTAHADRVIVPGFGENGAVVYQVRKRTYKLKTVLILEAAAAMTSQEIQPRFELRISEDDADVAYLRLPTHPKRLTKMSKNIRLVDLIGKYQGPDVILDFDENEVLVGIEVLA